VGLHASVRFLIRLISRFLFPRAVKHVQLLWNVSLLGLFSLPIPNDMCLLPELWNSVRICIRPTRRSDSRRTTGILRHCSRSWRVQSRKLLNDLSVGPPSFSFEKIGNATARALATRSWHLTSIQLMAISTGGLRRGGTLLIGPLR
jgi:hypothetical protein